MSVQRKKRAHQGVIATVALTLTTIGVGASAADVLDVHGRPYSPSVALKMTRTDDVDLRTVVTDSYSARAGKQVAMDGRRETDESTRAVGKGPFARFVTPLQRYYAPREEGQIRRILSRESQETKRMSGRR